MPQPMRRRTYVDASVYGGVFDEEFDEDSRAFFGEARADRFLILTSALVTGEISRAPQEVRDLYDQVLRNAELIQIGERALELQAAYLSERNAEMGG